MGDAILRKKGTEFFTSERRAIVRHDFVRETVSCEDVVRSFLRT